MSIAIMQCQYFLHRQRIIRILKKKKKKKKSDATFYIYRISNSVVNSIMFFRAKTMLNIKFYKKCHKSKYFYVIYCLLKFFQDQNLLI